MVHALEHTQSLLVPVGKLINIQPLPVSHQVQINHFSSETKTSWSIDRTDISYEQAALDALATALSDGYFLVECEREFLFKIAADNLLEFQEILSYWWDSDELVDRTIKRINALYPPVAHDDKLVLQVPARMSMLCAAH